MVTLPPKTSLVELGPHAAPRGTNSPRYPVSAASRGLSQR